MGDPIMEYPVYNIPKGTRAFGVGGVHDRLPIIIEYYKQNPGEAEKNGESI
jgi:hypothetical protein